MTAEARPAARYDHCRHCAWRSVYHWDAPHTTPCGTAGCIGSAPMPPTLDLQ